VIAAISVLLNIRLNMADDHDKPVVRTSDYYLTAFLLAHGFVLLGLDGEPPRYDFLLEDSDPVRRAELEERFRTGSGDSVSASRLMSEQKRLQRLLKAAPRKR